MHSNLSGPTEQSVIGMFSLLGEFVIGMFSLLGEFVIGMFSLLGEFVIGIDVFTTGGVCWLRFHCMQCQLLIKDSSLAIQESILI